MTCGRYQNGCRYHLRYLISADCKAVRGKGSEVATSKPLFLRFTKGLKTRPHRFCGLLPMALLRSVSFVIEGLRPAQAHENRFFDLVVRLSRRVGSCERFRYRADENSYPLPIIFSAFKEMSGRADSTSVFQNVSIRTHFFNSSALSAYPAVSFGFAFGVGFGPL